jgi:Holliday junction resolvase RusA-like endonuclease
MNWTEADGVYSLHFLAPDTPWSTNQERKMHHMSRAAKVEAWKEPVIWIARTLPPIEPPVVVRLHIPFRDKRRRDPHNYCGTLLKSVIDGLVVAGVIPDDSNEFLGHREPVLFVAKGPQTVRLDVWHVDHLTSG